MNKKIMAIGAHADDVELHFGGTLLKYLDRGYAAVYVMSTNNMSGAKRMPRPGGGWEKSVQHNSVETMEYRKREAAAAAAMYKTEAIHLDHPQRKTLMDDGKGGLKSVEVRFGSPLPVGVDEDVPSILTAYSDAKSVQRLANLIVKHDPEVILTQGHAEVNPEHNGTFLLVVKGYEKAVENGYRGALLYGPRRFTQLGRMANCWETFIDITGYVERRMETVLQHVSQYPVEFKHGAVHWKRLSEWRGKMSAVGAAEVYNFVTAAPEADSGTDVLNELLANRCDQQPWGLLSPSEFATSGNTYPRDE